MTQTEQVHRYLSSGKPLTVASAMSKLGVYALSQRCGELRRKGIPVQSAFVKTRSGKTIKRYWL